LKECVVSIARVENIFESVQKAVSLAGGLGLKKDGVVVIKPNVKNQSQPGSGVVTDIRLVEAMIDLAFREGAGRVVIAEGAAYPSGGFDTMSAFESTGLTEIAGRWGVNVVDLNDYADSVEVLISNGLVLERIKVGRAIIEADSVINMPVLKTHKHTLMSGCLKNVGVGCVTRHEKKMLHRVGLDEGIVDVYSLIRPQFHLVDAIVALEGDGPNSPPGKPKPLGLIVGGKDGLAVDIICAEIMGLNPDDVKHLVLACQQKLGCTKRKAILVKGEKLDKIVTEFELPNLFKEPIKRKRHLLQHPIVKGGPC
jgi:uncharacterized protein (DUF362 family)